MPGNQLTIWWVNQYAVVPTGSGGTRHYDMSRELRRLGLNTRVVASDLSLLSRSYALRSGPLDLRHVAQDVEGVPFSWLPAGSYRANDWRRAASMLVFAVAVFIFLMTRRLRKEDVIIGSSPHLFGALAAWTAAKLRRRPFVFEVRDLWPESFTAVSGQDSGLGVTLMRRVSDLLYRNSDAIVILAEGSRDVVVQNGGDPRSITWIPNGVDTSSFRPREERATFPPVRFVYAGAHGPANGLDVVVDAVAMLRDRGRDDVEVLLVGDGPVKAALAEQATRLDAPVTFQDPVPKSEVPDVLSSCDVGLMVLADVELFSFGVSPNKLFDYMAADLPVLTNVPGFVSHVVKDSRCGTSVAAGDATALADGMEMMADHLLAGDERFTSGRAYIEQNFERRALARQLASVLRSVSR
ncbi:MAG: glycosyltransferase family 4 protein [Acidimicrobiales bacterium]|nr:glycosyltransferase family 4 protein [Acidimicrobiales bacterium]